MRQHLGYIFILLAATQWSLLGPISLFCLKGGMTPVEIAFWRTGIAGTLFCLHAGCTGTLRLESKRDGLAFLLFGAIGIGGLFTVYQGAIKEGGAALAAILAYTSPVWVAIASRVFFQEALTPVKLAAICISLGGVVCISLSGGNGVGNITPLAILLGLASGLLYSSHYIFTRRYLERYSPFAIYGFSMFAACAVCFPFVSIDLERVSAVWLPLLAASVMGSYTSFWVYSEGIRRVEPTKAVVLATVEPMLATVVAWWWWGEMFSTAGWIGMGLVLSAVFLIIFWGNRQVSTASQKR